jgi:hypothetical protein
MLMVSSSDANTIQSPKLRADDIKNNGWVDLRKYVKIIVEPSVVK